MFVNFLALPLKNRKLLPLDDVRQFQHEPEKQHTAINSDAKSDFF